MSCQCRRKLLCDRQCLYSSWWALAQGKLEGYEVQCPWHASGFDIRTGKVARPPVMRSEPTYEIKKEENDNILLKKRANQDQS